MKTEEKSLEILGDQEGVVGRIVGYMTDNVDETATLLAYLTPVLTVLGGIGSALVAVNAGFSLAGISAGGMVAALVPLLPVMLAISAAVLAIAALGFVIHKHWDDFGPTIDWIGEKLTEAFSPLKWVERLSTAFNNITGSGAAGGDSGPIPYTNQRGLGSSTVNNTTSGDTTINVNGVTDPKAVAKEVARQQQRQARGGQRSQ
jgi:hypothetical protein